MQKVQKKQWRSQKLNNCRHLQIVQIEGRDGLVRVCNNEVVSQAAPERVHWRVEQQQRHKNIKSAREQGWLRGAHLLVVFPSELFELDPQAGDKRSLDEEVNNA